MKILKRLLTRFRRLTLRKPEILNTRFSSQYPLKKLGSKYGGWVFSDTSLADSDTQLIMISGGLGEDASFDIEFAKKYNCKILLVDPTPKAILHFNHIIDSLGSVKEREYSVTSGKQPINSYPLDDLRGTLQLCPIAMWNLNTELQFFLPIDPTHVSCSISDIQNSNKKVGESLTVRSMRLIDICNKYQIDKDCIDILKLDIEGAEVEVLEDMLASNIKPKQILVEYDELMFPSRRNYDRVQAAHARLIDNGYTCYYTDSVSCFSYIISDL